MSNNKKKPASILGSAPKTDVKMTPQQIEFMLRHVIRLPNLFTLAKGQMPAKVFGEQEAAFAKVWTAVMEVEVGDNNFFTNPESSQLAVWSYLQPRLTQDTELPLGFKEYILDPNNGLLKRIFTDNAFSEPEANKLLKRFLVERIVQNPLLKKLHQADGRMLIDLPEVLSEAQQLNIALAAMDDDPVESGAPENWAPVKLNKFPSGIKFIDDMLRGGHAPGEVYGVLGAFASGKTSLAVQIAYNTAMTQQFLADERNAVEPEESGITHYPKECYLFTYEATSDEIRMRLWSSACSIEHGVLEEFDWNKLSTKEHLKPYEVEYYKDRLKAGHKDQMVGEYERLQSKMPLLRKNLWVLDMSGTGKNTKRGTGYVPEIRQIIAADLERKSRVSGRKHEVGVVVIDYAGLAAKRHMLEHGVELSELRHYIGGFGDRCKKELAVPLGCPVWVFHQLTGEANKRTYKVQQHYTDAAESKGFAENLAFCFALGTKDEDTNTLLFSCSKARRAQIGHPPTLVIEGDYFRLAESKLFTYDTKLRTFVRKSDMKNEASPIDNASATADPAPDKPATKFFDPVKIVYDPLKP